MTAVTIHRTQLANSFQGGITSPTHPTALFHRHIWPKGPTWIGGSIGAGWWVCHTWLLGGEVARQKRATDPVLLPLPHLPMSRKVRGLWPGWSTGGLVVILLPPQPRGLWGWVVTIHTIESVTVCEAYSSRASCSGVRSGDLTVVRTRFR